MLLVRPDVWCRYAFARTASGLPCGTFSPEAVQWDLSSAICRYTGLPTSQSEVRIRATEAWSIWCQDNSKSEHPCQRTLHDFNDTTNYRWLKLALEQAHL